MGLFRDEARESLRTLIAGALRIEAGEFDSELFAAMFRDAHTIKGGARLLGLGLIAEATELLEARLQGLRDATIAPDKLQGTLFLDEIDRISRLIAGIGVDPQSLVRSQATLARPHPMSMNSNSQHGSGIRANAPEIDFVNGQKLQRDTTVRVRTERIDQLVALVSEARRIASQGKTDVPTAVCNLALNEMLGAAEAAALRLRLVPVGGMFDNLRRAVRDAAHDDGKDAELFTTGGEVEADGAIVDSATEIVLQLVRNAVAHGLESSAERLSRGKSARGSVRLVLRVRAHWLEIVVADDGSGINTDAVRAKAHEQGLDPKLSIRELIFSPGLSTRKVKDALGGQGIGLDIVETRCREIGGEIEVDWIPGEGTTFSVRIPVTALFERLLTGTIDGQLVGVQADIVDRIEKTKTNTEPDESVQHQATSPKSISLDDYPDEVSALTFPLGPLFASAAISRRGWIAANGRVGLILDLTDLDARSS